MTKTICFDFGNTRLKAAVFENEKFSTEIILQDDEPGLGILPGHAPLITELQIGEISYRRDKLVRYLSVAWGFCEVLPDRVIVLAEIAEKAEEIDEQRASAAKDRAEKRLADVQNPDIDFDRAAVALQRAISRIQTSRKHGSPE